MMRATLTAREVSNLLGVSYWLLLQEVKKGTIPHFKVGGKILFRKQALDKWMEQREADSIKQGLNDGKIRKLEER